MVVRVPRPPERASAFDRLGDAGVGSLDVGVDNVHAVVVLEGRVRALPRRDAAAAIAQADVAVLQPRGAEAVQEVGLSGGDAVVEVRAAIFADVDLSPLSERL